MRFRAALFGLGLSIANTAAAAQVAPLPWKDAAPAPPTLSPDFAKLAMPPVVVTVPGMDKVRYIRDLTYSETKDAEVRMDLYLPAKASRPVPVVLFIHGGGGLKSLPKDWGVYQSWGRIAAASGMAGVTFTQHLGFPETKILEGAADVTAAIAFVRANAAKYGLDANRICLAAYSAGGPMLAPYMVDAPTSVKCLVGWYPILDIRDSEPHKRSETPATLTAYSNILRLSEAGRKTPFYLVRAGNDQIPGLKGALDQFVAEALKTDYPLTLANAPGAPHGLDNQVNDMRTREIVIGVVEFLRGRLGLDPRIEGAR